MPESIAVNKNDNGVYELGLNTNENNSLGLKDFSLLGETITALRDDPKIRVLIIHSARPGVFSQGLNLVELSTASEESIMQFVRLFYSNLRNIYEFPHPVICSMAGHAMGYGCMIALASDYRFMPEKARIGLPEVKLGIRVPIFIANLLQRLIGVAEADHHILEGGAYKGAEAKALGLIDDVIEPENALAAAQKCAQRFLKNSRSGVTASKLAARYWPGLDEILQIDFDDTIKTLRTPDAKEGVSAAIEMRRPSFK